MAATTKCYRCVANLLTLGFSATVVGFGKSLNLPLLTVFGSIALAVAFFNWFSELFSSIDRRCKNYLEILDSVLLMIIGAIFLVLSQGVKDGKYKSEAESYLDFTGSWCIVVAFIDLIISFNTCCFAENGGGADGGVEINNV